LALRPLDCTLFFADAESQTETKKKRGPRTLPPLSLRRLPSSSSIDLQHPPSPLPRIIHCGYYGYVGFVVSRHVVLQSALCWPLRRVTSVCLSVCPSVCLAGWLCSNWRALDVLRVRIFSQLLHSPFFSPFLLSPHVSGSGVVRMCVVTRGRPKHHQHPPATARGGNTERWAGGNRIVIGPPSLSLIAIGGIGGCSCRVRNSKVPAPTHVTWANPIPFPPERCHLKTAAQSPHLNEHSIFTPPPPSALPPLPCLHSAPSSNHISSRSSRTSFCPERTPPPIICLFVFSASPMLAALKTTITDILPIAAPPDSGIPEMSAAESPVSPPPPVPLVATTNPKAAAQAAAADAKNIVRRKLTGYVGFANLPNQWHRKSVRKGFNFNVMVVGTSRPGAGRTEIPAARTPLCSHAFSSIRRAARVLHDLQIGGWMC